MGKMEDRMKKGMKSLMKNASSARVNSRTKPIDIDLSKFANMVNEDEKKAGGGMMKKKGYAKGGMMKKKGYAKGGMMKKGYAKGGKVRGAGRASKGVRPAKMVTMKGS